MEVGVGPVPKSAGSRENGCIFPAYFHIPSAYFWRSPGCPFLELAPLAFCFEISIFTLVFALFSPSVVAKFAHWIFWLRPVGRSKGLSIVEHLGGLFFRVFVFGFLFGFLFRFLFGFLFGFFVVHHHKHQQLQGILQFENSAKIPQIRKPQPKMAYAQN